MTQLNPDPLYSRLFESKPRKGDLRKMEIVQTAIRSIATVGIENTTLDSIGAELGVRRSHIAYYFKRKEELIETAVKLITLTAQDITIQRLQKAENPREQIAAQVRAVFEWGEKHPQHLSVFALMYYYGTFDESYRKLHSEIREAGRARLRLLLQAAQPKRKLTANGWDALTLSIQNLVFGSLLFHATTVRKRSFREQRESTVDAVMKLLDQ